MDLEQPVIRISVRNLVEFILRAGDIDNRIASTDKDTMQLGSRIHRKIQKQDVYKRQAHGATLSAVWGSWARYVYHLDEARFANYGRKVWNIDEENDEKTAVAAIEKTEEFFRSLHMPTCLGDMKMGCLLYTSRCV